MQIIMSEIEVVKDGDFCMKVMDQENVLEKIKSQLSDERPLSFGEFETANRFVLGCVKRTKDGQLGYMMFGIKKEPGLDRKMVSAVFRDMLKDLLKDLGYSLEVVTTPWEGPSGPQRN